MGLNSRDPAGFIKHLLERKFADNIYIRRGTKNRVRDAL